MERTFTKEEILQLIDDAVDYQERHHNDDPLFNEYWAGINYMRGWMEAAMNYRISGKHAWED